MIKDKIFELLEKEGCDKELEHLIEKVLEQEQRFISFQLQTNSGKLKEIKQTIREAIDQLTDDGYEVWTGKN